MLKVVILTRRRPGLSREEFDRHLRETHLPLVARLPGLRRLVANSVLADPTGVSPEWDMVGEDWFDSPEAWQAALASPAGQAVIADGACFVDPSASRFLLVEEVEIALPAGCPAGAVAADR
jgi:uncharacterized protein (TIGR02118 family)